MHHIPNGLDTEVFRPFSKTVAREVLGLDPKEDVVLFSALDAGARRKGGQVLSEALEILRSRQGHSVRLLAVGNGAERWQNVVRMPVTPLPAVKDDRLLAVIYSAADLLVFPTLAENLPNGVIESMACGTPVVAFDVGGVSEAVRPMETGYLATRQDPADLACGISRLLKDSGLRERLGRRCREVAEAEYSLDLQARRFQELYQGIRRVREMEPSEAGISRYPVER
jgi:glycosyltransferase involved in cell wall biosynthesis